MVRIFIEGQELDVNEGFSQQITYAVDDLQNLDSKSTAFSKTIVIPGTSNNNKLFGNIFEFTNSNFTGTGANVGYNFNASKAAKVRLEINGLSAIKGVLRLLTIIHDGENIEYEVAIFGELGGFVNSLGNKKLEDLDFSVYNHDYTIANIEQSWLVDQDINLYGQFIVSGNYLYIAQGFGYYNLANINVGQTIVISGTTLNNGTYTILETYYDVSYDGPDGVYFFFYARFKLSGTIQYEYGNFTLNTNTKGSGYYYPLIDYGLVSTNKADYKYNAFRPALYVREYMDKIITDAGYTYESNFFDSDFFRRLIVPNNQSDLQYYQTRILDADFNYSWYPGATPFTRMRFYNINTSFFSYNDGVFNPTFTEQTFVRFRIRAVVNISPQSFLTNNQTFGFDIKMGYSDDGFGLSYAVGETIYSYRRLKSQGATSFSIDILTDYIDITQQEEFIFIIYFIYPQELTFLNSQIEFFTQENTFVPVLLGEPIRLNELLPKNILQKDFFTSILKMFYLMVTEDKDKNNHLIIEPWVEFYNLSRASYLDWSDKIDRSQPIKIVPMSEINSRYYNLNYKSDNDYFNEDYKKKFNEGYGNVVFDNQLDFAKDSSTTEVTFSATPLVGYEDEDKVVSTIFKWDGKTSSSEERVSSNIRILQSKLIEGVSSWDILDLNGTTILDSFTNYPYAGHLDDPDVPGSDLSFGIPKQLYFNLAAGALGNNLFNTFYSSYLAEITDKDSRLVIAKIKLNEQDIFNLDFGRFIWIDGVLYRLSRIIDYTAGEICTIELLRVIYTTYQTGSPAQMECILTEDSICITTEDDNNLTIEN